MFDFLDLDDRLTEEEQRVRDTARKFADDQLRPIIDDQYLAGEFPTELIPRMGDLDFFAPTLDAYGLPGISETAWGALQRELAAVDSGIRSFVNGQSVLVIAPIHRFGSVTQQERWIPDLATGEIVGCFGLTEPDHGSDPSGLETVAERSGDEYELRGSKKWITSAPIADLAIVWARDLSQDSDPVRGFLIETDIDGITVEEIDRKLSMRCSPVGRIELDNVRIPSDAVLPGTDGLRSALSCNGEARYGIAWSTAGVARDCLETAQEYATEREQFGQPIGGFQLQQAKLAEMATQVTHAQLLALQLSRMKEQGDLQPEQAAMGKRANTKIARDVARTAREMLGGNGITTDHPPMRHLSNIESVYTYEGTFDIQSLILGRELTGIAAFT